MPIESGLTLGWQMNMEGLLLLAPAAMYMMAMVQTALKIVGSIYLLWLG